MTPQTFGQATEIETMELETNQTTQKLPVALTDAEVLDMARRCSELSREHGHVEAQKKEEMLVFKPRLEQLESEIAELHEVVRSGKQWRDVACEEAFHRDLGEVTVTRLDTGRVVETRAMTKAERQMSMGL